MQEGEPELPDAPVVVDAREAVDDLVERHTGKEKQLHRHDAEHRPSVLDQADQHRELAVARDELPGAVERVDQPEARRRRGKPRLRHGFLGDDRDVGKRRRQHLDDDPLGSEIGLGDRCLVVLLRHLERVGIDAHDRFAASQCRAQRNVQEGIRQDALLANAGSALCVLRDARVAGSSG